MAVWVVVVVVNVTVVATLFVFYHGKYGPGCLCRRCHRGICGRSDGCLGGDGAIGCLTMFYFTSQRL